MSLAVAVHSDLGGDNRMLVNWKAIAMRRAFLSSNSRVESSESDDKMMVSSSDSGVRDGSDVKEAIESLRGA